MTSQLSPLAPEFLAFQAAVAGSYSIVQELGRGGMGVVFLAREVALDRMVALKLLLPEVASRPGAKENFLKEARTAARLSHPNIVQIYAVNEVDDFVFFAMAYVDGGTLGDRIRERGPLSNSEGVKLLREVSWALGHAHLQGVVHRDVKPDNILIEADTGRAMVTDFGIAAVGEEVEIGSDGPVVGTAEFMSPEQAAGGRVDARSDVYSLGCLGFYSLSGRVPFLAEEAAAVLVAHVNEPPPPLLSAAPLVPPAVATALDRCLRKDPDARFPAGDAVADALRSDREADRELPVPLRVFIKETREWETVVSLGLFGILTAGPGVLIALEAGAPPWVIALFGGILGAGILGPIPKLLRAARRLLKSGFGRADATDAFALDIDKKDEEYRFQVGERVTQVDRIARVLKRGSFLGAGISFGLGIFGGLSEPFMAMGLGMFDLGILAALVQEYRARARGDIMGERYLKLWQSWMGKGLFRLASVRLDRVTPALSAGAHRATETVIGLEADRLFEELPEETQQTLAGLPQTVKTLEEDAKAMRQQVAEMTAILAEIGDDDPTRPGAAERTRVRANVEATRDEARGKLREAVAALEKIRLGLLYMQAGVGSVDGITMELEAAKGISHDMANLLEGHREVERILEKRQVTGVFTLPSGEDE